MRKGVLSLLFLIGVLFVSIAHAAVPDQDKDGVPDAYDKCPNSDTNLVDQFGCSCAQLVQLGRCPSDDNPCTDDCSADTTGRVACRYAENNKECRGGYYMKWGRCV